MIFSVTADLSGVLPRYRILFEAAIQKMSPVLSSPLFLENLKDEISKSNLLEGELSIWRTKSAQEIISQLGSTIHLKVLTYYTANNVIGYGNASTVDIYVNTKYLVNDSVEDLEDLMDIGSNLVHEHGHDCGFEHDFRSTKRRPNSICYVLNRAYDRTFRQVYGLPDKPQIVYAIPWWRKILNVLK
jgi:hypothetical protein